MSMSLKKTNILVILILLLLCIVLSCNKTITIQRAIRLKISASSAGRTAAIKQYNKNGLINVCIVPTWYGESNREFINDSCSCKIFEKLNPYGIKSKTKKIKLDFDNNYYEISYWSYYKTTMDSLISDKYGKNFIDSLCQIKK